MAQKQLLHQLLNEDQEPFRLKSYIADRRSQLKKPGPTTSLQLKNPRPIIPETFAKPGNLCKHACFFSFQNSPDVKKSPFPDFQSPAMSPCKSPNGDVFLHIPSKTSAILLEAAMRIQKQQQSKPTDPGKNVGFGLFGSFLKKLKDRSKNKKRAIGDTAVRISRKKWKKREEETEQQNARISCSSNDRRMSGCDWTESSGVKSVDFEASTSSSCSDDFASRDSRFCSSPFRFSLHRSRSTSSGRRTPDFCSPAASPRAHEKECYDTRNSDKVRGGGGDEEKEQCSPVSVLEPPFEDDGRESEDAEEEDYDLDCSYANVQRAKQQLLSRLRRFEKLAGLDPIELERKLLEGSDDDCEEQSGESDEYVVPFSPQRKHGVDVVMTEVFNQSTFRNQSKKISNDMKRLVSDLIVEEKGEIACSNNNEVVFGRICNRLDSWKEVEFDTIDMMIELDFKKDSDEWKRFSEHVEETTEDIEFAIYGLLMEELSEELCYVDGYHQEDKNAGIEFT